MQDELVFNPRKMSVAMVEAELAKRSDLTIDQIKALLAQEGSQLRPRKGVERALDARLLALAEEAIEAASEDMMSEGAPDESAEEAPPIDAMTDADIARQPGETIADHVHRMGEAQSVEPVSEPENLTADAEARISVAIDEIAQALGEAPNILRILFRIVGEMTAEQLSEYGLCRMMGPDPDAPMEPEGHEDITEGTPVHVQMTEREVHTGYYVKAQPGAMIRMRDGQDTIIFMPEGSFWVSPSDEVEGGD